MTRLDFPTPLQVLSQKRSVGEIVDFWSLVHPDHPAMIFLEENGQSTARSYRELRDEALRVAAELSRTCQVGDRAILLLPPGADFIAAFLGCLYAGVLAVPATEPKPRRLNDRLSVVAQDCEPTAVLCTSDVAERIEVAVVCPPLAGVPWIRVDQLETFAGRTDASLQRNEATASWMGAESVALPAIDGDALAFLQYTSGSTSDPKGVAVSHRNLLHNLEMIRVGFGQRFNFESDPRMRGVFWLPPYHDMGLIGGILTPLYLGGTTVLMSPTSFLKRPLQWLQTISDQRAIISGAPNFAYDLCASQIRPADQESLDLSCWEVAFCGAEPIRAETVDRFCATFEPQGMRRESFYPCYGMAEATLLVSGNPGRCAPVIKSLDRAALEEHRVVDGTELPPDQRVRVVGCGEVLLGGEVVIVEPATRRALEPGRIGEIWYRGESVAEGYWNQPAKSRAVFQAQLDDRDNRKRYLRTGDMGFLAEGQLYVTGRLKEMLVIRGRNFYPQDLEATAAATDSALAPGAAAFAVEIDGAEQLVLVQELDRQSKADDYGPVLTRIRTALAEAHDIRPAAIVLVRAFSLPRTTSGKMQRLLCKKMFLQDQLKVVARWDAPRRAASPNVTVGSTEKAPAQSIRLAQQLPTASAAFGSMTAAVSGRDAVDGRVSHLAEDLEQWLCHRLAALANLPAEEVTADRPLAEFGLDSMTTVQLAAEIEERHKLTLNPIAMWNYPTARHLARYLAEQILEDFAPTTGTDVVTERRPTFEALLREIEQLDEQQVIEQLESGDFGSHRGPRLPR